MAYAMPSPRCPTVVKLSRKSASDRPETSQTEIGSRMRRAIDLRDLQQTISRPTELSVAPSGSPGPRVGDSGAI